jgi:hypothetical protein
VRRYFGLAVALLLVAGLILFAVNEVRRDKAEGRKATLETIFPYGGTQVAEVSLLNPDGAVAFRRGAGGWEKIEGPAEADTGSVADLVGAWSRVRILSVVDEAPRAEDLGRFGLDRPSIVLRAKLTDPAAAVTPGREPSLEVGKPAPLDPAFYAKVDGFPRVVLVSLDVVDFEKGIGRRVMGLPVLVDEDDHRAEPSVQTQPVR